MSRVLAESRSRNSYIVSKGMTTSIATLPLEIPVSEAANLMSQNHLRLLPALQDGKLYGALSLLEI